MAHVAAIFSELLILQVAIVSVFCSLKVLRRHGIRWSLARLLILSTTEAIDKVCAEITAGLAVYAFSNAGQKVCDSKCL